MMRYKMDIMDAKRETREETRQEDISIIVEMLRDLHLTNDQIQSKISKRFNLTAEEARNYVN